LHLIRETVPHVSRIIPLRTIAYRVRRREHRFDGQVVGTLPEFFRTVNIDVASGRVLTPADMESRARVCVIGDEVRQRLFTYEDPIGQTILVERREVTTAYSVVGVLERALTAGSPAKGVEERNLNKEVYVPLSTAESRYGDVLYRMQSGTRELLKFDYSNMYITADSMERVEPVAAMTRRVLEHNHENLDYELRVPLALLQAAEKKKRNTQLQLGLIAGISLLVGGIGIMNIMLATVTERTREIGIRRALGAKHHHIVAQFLTETLILSMAGGITGVILGYIGSAAMTRWAQWGDAIVRPEAVAISFGLSVLVGVSSGLYPAFRAAGLDPIEALRHE
jgi:putative ABC transport system permease protein